MTERQKCILKAVPEQARRSQHRQFLKKTLGVLLIVVGFLALVTPFTPGSWLVFVGAELLGIRIAFWDRLRRWWHTTYTGNHLIHKQAITAMETEVGKVVHYYDKLGVAIIELQGPLAVGDTIKVKRGEEEFEQQVTSMQVEHAAVESAKKGAAVGVTVDQKTKEGAIVYKVTA